SSAATVVRVPPPDPPLPTQVASPEPGSRHRETRSFDGPAPPDGGGLPDVPGYAVSKVLGRGGMGVVYEAVSVGLNRPVALKVLSDEMLARPGHRSRFRDEAEAVARLAHPNVVQIYEV